MRLLAAIWDGPGTLEPHLLDLKRQEFLHERPGTSEPVYVFKHALTQDVAYDSMLTARRRALHEAAAQALERLHADRLEEAYDRLAHHYSKTAQADKAVEYLSRFAETTFERLLARRGQRQPSARPCATPSGCPTVSGTAASSS